MAVQILNDMPDAAVHRGEPLSQMLNFESLRPTPAQARFGGRAGFAACTIALHVVAAAAFFGAQHHKRVEQTAEPMIASLIEAPRVSAETPPDYMPPAPQLVTYALPVPQDVSYESESIAPPVVTTAITAPAPQVVAPPMVESVEYVRAPTPVYPSESNRRRERGTVVLRVLVDASGHPAQIQIERSSGFSRLDTAARDAVEKALFRPHEVNGIAQPAQVLIPIEFTRRAT